MPRFCVRLVSEALNEDRKAVNGSKVLVVGVAYKADVADVRESPALDIIQLLRDAGAEITYHDPYVPSLNVGDGTLESSDLTEETLGAADCVVVTTRHAGLDFDLLARSAKVVIDTRNAFPLGFQVPAGGARIVKL